MSNELKFVDAADSQQVPNADLDRHVRELGTKGERQELDLKTIIDEQFAAGEVVLSFAKDTPDEVILRTIKHALGFGKPFMVVPA